jgi:hypothetical protein
MYPFEPEFDATFPDFDPFVDAVEGPGGHSSR